MYCFYNNPPEQPATRVGMIIEIIIGILMIIIGIGLLMFWAYLAFVLMSCFV